MTYDPEYTPTRLTDAELTQVTRELNGLTLEAQQIAVKALALATKINGHFEAGRTIAQTKTQSDSDAEIAAYTSFSAAIETFDEFSAQGEVPTTFPPFS